MSTYFITVDRCKPFFCLFTSPATLGESHDTEVIKLHPKITPVITAVVVVPIVRLHIAWRYPGLSGFQTDFHMTQQPQDCTSRFAKHK